MQKKQKSKTAFVNCTAEKIKKMENFKSAQVYTGDCELSKEKMVKKGYKQSEEHSRKIGDALRFPREFRKCEKCEKEFKCIITSKRRFCCVSCGISFSKKGKKRPPYSEEWIKNISEGRLKGIKEGRIPRINSGSFEKGHKRGMYGKHHREDSKKKYVETRRKNNSFKVNSGCFKKGDIPYNKGKKAKKETIEKNRLNGIKMWQNKEYAEKTIKSILNSLIKRPTSYEKKIAELCIEFSLPFIYTGNGTFLIGHKNPDFVNKRDKIAIEVYNDYFKIRDFGSCEEYEKQRSEYFAKYRYKTIFIRKNEIMSKDWKELCLTKINGRIKKLE